MTRPERRWTVVLNVSGDEWPDVSRELARLAEHVQDHGPECNSASGSPSVGSYVQVTERPDMTHERYFAELETWLAAKRDKGTESSGRVHGDEK